MAEYFRDINTINSPTGSMKGAPTLKAGQKRSIFSGGSPKSPFWPA